MASDSDLLTQYSHTRRIPSPSNTPSSTLAHLSHTLSSLLSSSFHSFSTPNASHLAESLSQLLHDHSWEHPDDNDHTPHHAIPPNLVLLFSPSFTSLTSLASFLDSDAGLVAHSASFCGRLSLVFSNVSRAFASKGIHCCWISIGSEIGRIETDEAREACCLLETGLGRLGWGFCSLDSILLGSALVPFGLVYPKIGVLWDSVCFSSRDANNVGAQLSLRMLDVKGIPIEYSDCDLEFVDVKVLGGSGDLNLQGGGCGRKERFWKLCLDGGVKLEVKIVQRCDAFVGIEEWLSDSVLVREDFRGLKKKVKGGLDGFFADRVLELVAGEFGCEWRRKQVPVWEILLSFLYREGCWALVSVTNGKGGSCIAILRPFTVFAALLSVLGDPHGACSFGEENVGQYVRMVDNEICGSDGKFNKKEDLLDSQGKKSTAVVEGHQRKKMVDLNTVRDLTWNLFCKLVYDQFETNLLEVYYTMEGNKSKKLRFLKCWIKQMKKSGCSSLALLEKPKPNPIVAEEASSKLNDLTQNAEQPIFSFASAEINPEPEALRIQEDAVLDFRSETSESFFSNLADRINRGIESEVVDTGALAERLVNSSIYWLCQKVDRETISQSQSPLKDHNACGSMIASELMKLLLREPKEIVAKHKSQNPSKLHLSMIGFHSGPIADHVVREYELQILFRMEILQSEVGSEVEDSCKQKFVKQICLLLENIMCHMETGFFGDWTLENYVTKIIKNRYSLALEDVVQRIYNKMDLLLFADEDEAPNSLLNSEDSYKPLKKKTYRDEKDGSGRFQRIEDGDHKKLIEAKEKRERAQRFSSFTSSMPVLRRVRATKQKGMKPKTDLLQRVQKRKERERASYGTVCETPMTGNKRSSPRARSSDDDNGLADRSQSYGSVSKALFMDDL
ncbi:hypothetical protein GYH30_044366 [Glycine max]|nr:hypothetical protein GYH30_044366 [Glycine max]